MNLETLRGSAENLNVAARHESVAVPLLLQQR